MHLLAIQDCVGVGGDQAKMTVAVVVFGGTCDEVVHGGMCGEKLPCNVLVYFIGGIFDQILVRSSSEGIHCNAG